ncbi:MAG TPA: hypothetical protein VK043_03550 [Burkholderiales bacterium]|nr:hypothetical protein [Burkholderiales bacterium]
MGLIQRIVAVVLALVFLVGVLVFASLALGVLLAVGLVAWGWLWWRTRGTLPKENRPYAGGAVVEGEYRDVTLSESLEERERRR